VSWLWGIGGLVALIAGFFLRGKLPMFNRRKRTIEKEIKELDKEKEVADADIEARRAAYRDRNPFE